MRTVVAAEKDQRVLILAGLFQLLDHPADVGVHAAHHCREALLLDGPRHVGVLAEMRYFHAVARVAPHFVVGVGNGVGGFQKPGALIFLFQELQRTPGEQVVRILFLARPEIAAQQVGGLAVEEMLGVVVMRVRLAEEAEPLVEPFARRVAGGAKLAERPLSEQPGPIARLLQDVGNGHVLWPEGKVRVLVAAGARMAGVVAGHQAAAGRRAYGRAGIGLRKAHPFRGDPVEVRCLHLPGAITAEIAVAEVVGQDQQDVRFSGLRGQEGGSSRSGGGAKE